MKWKAKTEIHIEQKYQDANDKYLGSNSGKENLTSYADKWDKEYELDLIGREYCRDRQIAVSREEYKTFEMWQQKRSINHGTL